MVGERRIGGLFLGCCVDPMLLAFGEIVGEVGEVLGVGPLAVLEVGVGGGLREQAPTGDGLVGARDCCINRRRARVGDVVLGRLRRGPGAGIGGLVEGRGLGEQWGLSVVEVSGDVGDPQTTDLVSELPAVGGVFVGDELAGVVEAPALLFVDLRTGRHWNGGERIGGVDRI